MRNDCGDIYGNIYVEVIHPTLFKRQEDVIYSLSSRNNLNLMKRENVPEMTRRHT